jgi:hypothetical protein
MLCYVRCFCVFVAIENYFWDINFSIWLLIVRTLCIYVSKDVWIRYFSKPEGVREHILLANTAVVHIQTAICAKAAFRRVLTDVKIWSPRGGDNEYCCCGAVRFGV